MRRNLLRATLTPSSATSARCFACHHTSLRLSCVVRTLRGSVSQEERDAAVAEWDFEYSIWNEPRRRNRPDCGHSPRGACGVGCALAGPALAAHRRGPAAGMRPRMDGDELQAARDAPREQLRQDNPYQPRQDTRSAPRRGRLPPLSSHLFFVYNLPSTSENFPPLPASTRPYSAGEPLRQHLRYVPEDPATSTVFRIIDQTLRRAAALDDGSHIATGGASPPAAPTSAGSASSASPLSSRGLESDSPTPPEPRARGPLAAVRAAGKAPGPRSGGVVEGTADGERRWRSVGTLQRPPPLSPTHPPDSNLSSLPLHHPGSPLRHTAGPSVSAGPTPAHPASAAAPPGTSSQAAPLRAPLPEEAVQISAMLRQIVQEGAAVCAHVRPPRRTLGRAAPASIRAVGKAL